MSKSFLINEQTAQPAYHQLSLAEEGELCVAIKSDPHQFQQLIELFYRRLFQHSYLHLDDEQAAEQICRQTFVRALEAFQEYVFSTEKPLSKWLYEIFRSVMSDNYPDVTEAITETVANSHSHSLANRDTRRLAIDAYLRALSFEERELLILHIYEQLPWDRITDLLPGDAKAISSTYERLLSTFEVDIQGVLDRIAHTHSALSDEPTLTING